MCESVPNSTSPLVCAISAQLADADSVCFSAHKWLWQPKGCGVVMFKDADPAHAAMSFGGGYLATPTVGVLGSAQNTSCDGA